MEGESKESFLREKMKKTCREEDKPIDSSSGVAQTPPNEYRILGSSVKVSTRTVDINYQCQDNLVPPIGLSDANLFSMEHFFLT